MTEFQRPSGAFFGVQFKPSGDVAADGTDDPTATKRPFAYVTEPQYPPCIESLPDHNPVGSVAVMAYGLGKEVAKQTNRPFP